MVKLTAEIKRVGKKFGITNDEAKKLQLIVAVDIKNSASGMVMINESYIERILHKVRPDFINPEDLPF